MPHAARGAIVEKSLGTVLLRMLAPTLAPVSLNTCIDDGVYGASSRVARHVYIASGESESKWGAASS